VQLKYLDRDNAYRRQIAAWYRERFEKYRDKIKLVNILPECSYSGHLFQILVDNRDEVILKLNAADIYPGVHYADNTLYRMYSYAHGTCPYAEYVSDHVLSLPIHLNLTYEDVQYVADEVIKIVIGTT